jgi:hypothetical protein
VHTTTNQPHQSLESHLTQLAQNVHDNTSRRTRDGCEWRGESANAVGAQEIPDRHYPTCFDVPALVVGVREDGRLCRTWRQSSSLNAHHLTSLALRLTKVAHESRHPSDALFHVKIGAQTAYISISRKQPPWESSDSPILLCTRENRRSRSVTLLLE